LDKKRYSFAIEGNYLSDNPLGVLRVTGEDAESFLQGQWSQDLKLLGEGQAGYGFWLNQKGKVGGDSLVRRDPAGEYLVCSWSMTAAALQERLEAYLIADEVELSEETDRWRAWWIGGVDAPAGIEAGDGCFAREASDLPWWRLVARSEPSWPAGWSIGAREDFERARIAMAWPGVPVDLGGEDLPQEGGRHEAGVSFNKGCYLGQEIMARVETTGRVRRKLVQVVGEGAIPEAAARELRQNDKPVAQLCSRVVLPEGGWMGLAMVALSRADFDEPLVLADSGNRVEFATDASEEE
jgi:folate-binding protein YgfZ